jgi:AcrR family transcriptional regulator
MARMMPNPKRAIFNSAKELLDNQGYSSLSMREIAKRSGVALGTIYNYFPNKQELVQDMMIVHWIEFTEKQAAIANSQLGIYVRLYTFFKEFSAFVGTFRQTWQSPELFHEQETTQEEAPRQASYLERVAECVENMLSSESARRGSEMRLRHGAHDTARFIVMNYMAMIQLPVFRYELFEAFLKDILR